MTTDIQIEDPTSILRAAAESGDPIAAQAMVNAGIADERHPEPAPTIVDHDCRENQLDIAEEIRTGKTVIRQTGHLEQA